MGAAASTDQPLSFTDLGEALGRVNDGAAGTSLPRSPEEHTYKHLPGGHGQEAVEKPRNMKLHAYSYVAVPSGAKRVGGGVLLAGGEETPRMGDNDNVI